jgi:arylformamidase
VEAANFNHFEMCESFGNPYGPNGLAALKLMKLA